MCDCVCADVEPAQKIQSKKPLPATQAPSLREDLKEDLADDEVGPLLMEQGVCVCVCVRVCVCVCVCARARVRACVLCCS